jgi:tryptophan synthase alpha chain
MGGYPDRDGALAALEAAAPRADLIELGVPYGDPLADGPTIREAGWESLGQGFGLADAFELARDLTGGTPGGKDGALPPIALMTYYNPMLQTGLAETAAAAAGAGVEGFIVPDLPPDAADDWLAASQGLDTVFLVAPTSTPARIRLAVERSRGFVYCVSSLGVTGVREELPADLTDFVRRVRGATDLPLAVGFGIGTPEMAAKVAAIADGVVVGSAIVAVQDDPQAVGTIVAELASALAS